MGKPFFVGIAGGSGSGKSTLTQQLLHSLSPESVEHISHDAYYRDQSAFSMADRQRTNYDHPNALETSLLLQHLAELRAERPIARPTYDFSQHTRAEETVMVYPKSIIVVEGILLFENEVLRNQLDMKVFVDTDADIRFARRLLRDVAERGRTFEFGIEQYLTFTKPMHEQFVEPSKRFADIIVPEGGLNSVAVSILTAELEKIAAGPNK